MHEKFEGYYPTTRVPLEFTIGEEEQDFTLTPENCRIVQYWDEPETVKIFREIENTNPVQYHNITHPETGELLMSPEFYEKHGWNPDIVTTTKNRPSGLPRFTYFSEGKSYSIHPSKCNIIQYHEFPMLDHILVAYKAPKLTPGMLPSDEIEQQYAQLFRPDLVEILQSERFNQQYGWRPDLYVHNRLDQKTFDAFDKKAVANLEIGLNQIVTKAELSSDKVVRKLGEEAVLSSRYPSQPEYEDE